MDTSQDKVVAEMMNYAGQIVDALNTYAIQEPGDQVASFDYACEKVREIFGLVARYQNVEGAVSHIQGTVDLSPPDGGANYHIINTRRAKAALFGVAQDLAELAYVLEEPIVSNEAAYVAVRLLSRIGILHQCISILLEKDPPAPPWENSPF